MGQKDKNNGIEINTGWVNGRLPPWMIVGICVTLLVALGPILAIVWKWGAIALSEKPESPNAA